MEFITTGSQQYRVQYDSWMDGGGTWFGQDYIKILQSRYPSQQFDHCLEWCSGPAFIGFNLMDHNICKKLTAIDLYEPATQAVEITAKQHNLGDLVDTWCSDSIAVLPTGTRFDLVIANPPHYLKCPGDDNYQRIAVDHDWEAHRNFYQHIGKYITADSVVLIQENQAGSIQGVEEFRDMIESNGLEVRDHFVSGDFYNQPGPWCQIYYIEIGLAKFV